MRCAVLILAVLEVSPALCSLTASEQIPQTTKEEGEKKRMDDSTCYAVQVGAYENRAEVGDMLDKLAPEFPDRMILTQVATRDKTLWRLRVLATSRVEALKVSERLLAEQSIRAWIVPIACTDSAKGRLDHATLAHRIETTEPASPELVKIVPSSIGTQISTTIPKTESPAPVSERMVWLMTIATFLGNLFLVLLICLLYFRREQIREAPSEPEPRRTGKAYPGESSAGTV